MFQPWPELERRFGDALASIGDARPARITGLRNSSLFFFLFHLLEESKGGAAGGGSPTLP
ncbi:hypothetical protein IIA79_08295, partial [bacterium]|nr:hypothetical protein [bacterium]